MTTLLNAILYLWFVLTILLAVMWLLREQDRRRKDRREHEFEDELLSPRPPADIAAKQDPEQDKTSIDQQPVEKTENEPEKETGAEAAGATGVTSHGTGPEADAPAEPLPWSKTGKNKQKSKNGQRKRSKKKVRATEAPVEEPVEQTPEKPDQPEEPELVEPETAQLPGIVELLEGVTLPFDLTPLTTRIEEQNNHAIFISPHPDAAEVGTAFADELVQQGFKIEAAGFDQALATRGTDKLSMRISPDAGTVTDGSDHRYPTADKNDVAIEVWVGSGSPPPLAN